MARLVAHEVNHLTACCTRSHEARGGPYPVTEYRGGRTWSTGEISATRPCLS
jgi:hypothetical protein